MIIDRPGDMENYDIFTLSAEIGALVVAGALLDICFIAVFRWALRKLAAVSNFAMILWRLLVFAVIAALLIFPALILSLPPLSAFFFPSGISPHNADSVAMDLALAICYLSTTNLIDALCLLLLILVMLVLLVHRLLWPIIKRPIYAANRRQLIKNTKLLMAVGAVLLTYAFPNNPILRSVVDFFGKVKA